MDNADDFNYHFRSMRKRAVFLDRDGVITANVLRDGRPVAPRTQADFRLLPGAVEAVARLRKAGFLAVVVTNQPDVRTGHIAPEVMEAMHADLRRWTGVDDIRCCVHVDADGCLCRKPKPGMLTAAAAERGIDLAASYMVGDRWRDVAAGRAAGCRTVLVDTGYVEEREEVADATVGSLAEAAEWILRHEATADAE